MIPFGKLLDHAKEQGLALLRFTIDGKYLPDGPGDRGRIESTMALTMPDDLETSLYHAADATVRELRGMAEEHSRRGDIGGAHALLRAITVVQNHVGPLVTAPAAAHAACDVDPDLMEMEGAMWRRAGR